MDYVDFNRGQARLPDSKTGAKTLHLSKDALNVLKDLPRIAGNDYCFAGQSGGRPLVNINSTWRALKQDAGIENLRLHDARHNFASVAVSAGVNLAFVQKMLGHKHIATTQRYTHLADDPVKASVEATAEKIAKQMGRG
jgi:integrase